MRTAFHLVRHGQSEWNAEGRLQGQTPHVPLTALGRAQAEAAAEALRGSGAGAVYTSDLTRAVQTAAPIARALDVTAVVEPALREQALGALEGRLARDLPEPDPDPEQAVSAAELARTRWGGGESLHDVYHRVGPFLRRLLTQPPSPAVVLVSHGDTIRVAAAYLRGAGVDGVDWSGAVPNGSVTTIRVRTPASGIR
ncbi:MAG: histidine phosphatase family protein [Mycobacteriales bacterium]